MKLPVLQSGFLSLTEESLVQTEPLPDSQILRTIGLGKSVDASGNAFFYNTDVQKIFDDFNKDWRLMRQFEFREELLKTTLSAFGTLSLAQWFETQKLSPYLTATHRKFLNDTIKFIMTGERDVSVESWLGILTSREASSKDAEVKLLSDSSFNLDRPWESISPKLTNAITEWTAKPNGFIDLLYFLGIVFSKETIRSK